MSMKNKKIDDILDYAAQLEDEDEVSYLVDELSSSDIDVENEKEISEKIAEDDKEIPLTDTIRLYKKEISKFKVLSPEELNELYEKYENGDKKVLEKIINSNLKLVVFHSYKYIGQGVEQIDLIQEGNTGLIIAAKKFNYHKGYRFTTYATWWILQRMRKAIVNKNGLIKIPTYIASKVKLVQKELIQYAEQHGREPSVKELEKITGLSAKTISTILKAPSCSVSLDETICDSESSTIMDFISDDSPSIEKLVEDNFLTDCVNTCLETLTEREIFIISRHFGLNGHSVYSLGEIGEMMTPPLSRERVRQIEKEGLRKLEINQMIKDITA